MRGNEHQAKKDMQRLRQCDITAAHEMSLLRNAAGECRQTQVGAKSCKQRFEQQHFQACNRMCIDRQLRWPLIIAVLMMLSQQFSGINTVIYYSSEVFRSAGLSRAFCFELFEECRKIAASGAQLATLSTGGLNVLMTFVSVLLIDRFGRRPLHMTGLGVMLISSALFVTFKVLQVRYFFVNNRIKILCRQVSRNGQAPCALYVLLSL